MASRLQSRVFDENQVTRAGGRAGERAGVRAQGR